MGFAANAAVPPGSVGCTLQASGPIKAKDDQIIEFLSITTTNSTPGITVDGKKNVVIRNVHIKHQQQTPYPYGVGIRFSTATNLTITNVSVEFVGVESGPLTNCHDYNIWGRSSPGVHLSNIYTTGGSSGIELDHCDGAVIERVIGENLRGPWPRGQCVQLTYSD